MIPTKRKPAQKVTESEVKAGRKAKGDRAVKIWSNMGKAYQKVFVENKEGFSEEALRNTAIALTSEAKVLRKMSEEQVSTKFSSLAPQQILSIILLTYPNLNRGNIFTEIALTSPNEAVFFVKPFFHEPFIDAVTGDHKNMKGRSFAEPEDNPFGFNTSDDEWDPDGGRQAIMESKEFRFANELANAKCDGLVATFAGVYGEDDYGTEFGATSENFVDGYTRIFDKESGKEIATQLGSQKRFLISNAFADVVDGVTKNVAKDGTVSYTVELKKDADPKTAPKEIMAYGRFNAETDYFGKFLGEVELRPKMVRFTPQRTAIGVSWTDYTEVIMDTAYDLEAGNILCEAASQTINSQLDYQAVSFAYAIAKTNRTRNGKPMVVTFKAQYANPTVELDSDGKPVKVEAGAKDSYMDNAQTFTSCLGALSATMYNELQRGAVTHLVCGLDVMNYIKLLAGYSTKGKQSAAGIFCFGELDGIKLYAAPTDIIPKDEALAIFKNDRVDNDVALAFGTLVALTTGPIQRKNFWKEGAMCQYGDCQVFNPKYLSIIKVEGIKDAIVA